MANVAIAFSYRLFPCLDEKWMIIFGETWLRVSVNAYGGSWGTPRMLAAAISIVIMLRAASASVLSWFAFVVAGSVAGSCVPVDLGLIGDVSRIFGCGSGGFSNLEAEVGNIFGIHVVGLRKSSYGNLERIGWNRFLYLLRIGILTLMQLYFTAEACGIA